jgi:hypothetical protein
VPLWQASFPPIVSRPLFLIYWFSFPHILGLFSSCSRSLFYECDTHTAYTPRSAVFDSALHTGMHPLISVLFSSSITSLFDHRIRVPPYSTAQCTRARI